MLVSSARCRHGAARLYRSWTATPARASRPKNSRRSKEQKETGSFLFGRRSHWPLGQFWQRFACRLGGLRFHHSAAHGHGAIGGMDEARPAFGLGERGVRDQLTVEVDARIGPNARRGAMQHVKLARPIDFGL